MNSRVLTIAVLLAAVAACAYFLLFAGRSSAPAILDTDRDTADKGNAAQLASSAGKNGTTGASTSSNDKTPSVNWKRLSAMMGSADGSGQAVPKPTPEEITRFLAKHGETAVNLVAAFGITRDRRLLDRALELFPNSPVVLMAAIEAAPQTAPKPGEKFQPDPERMALIERFKAADPNNPLPWIFSAQELFKAGPNAAAIAAIRAALDHPAFYTYANERMDSTQQLYEDLGLHPVEASLLAMAGLTLPHMSAATQTSRMLMEWQKSATDSGDTATANEAIQLTYELGRTFATPEASRTLIGQLVGVSMEARALKALPTDAQPDWLAVAPVQRLSEMETQKQNVKDLTAGLDWVIQSRDGELLAEYLRRNRADGELSALIWLREQRK